MSRNGGLSVEDWCSRRFLLETLASSALDFVGVEARSCTSCPGGRMEKDMSASEGSQWAMDCQAPNETHKHSCNEEQTGRVPARQPPTRLTWTPPPVCTLRHYSGSPRQRQGGGRQACRKKYLSWSRSEADAVGRTATIGVVVVRRPNGRMIHWGTARSLPRPHDRGLLSL